MIDSSASYSSVAAVLLPLIRPILWHRRDQTGTQRTPSSLLATPRLTSSASPSDRIPLRGISPSLRCHLPFIRPIDLHRRDMTRTQRIPSPFEPPRLTPTASPCDRFLCVVFSRLCGAPSVYSPNPLVPQRPNRNAENTFYSAYPPSVPTCTHQPPEHRPLIGVLCVVFSRLCGALSVYSPNPFAPQRPNPNAENTCSS